MGFWGSFWRETGKNTGKWASNKVFGKGWSTPYSHDVNVTHHTSSSTSSQNNISDTDPNVLRERIYATDADEVDRSNRLLDEDFSDDPMTLFNQVSDYIAQLNTRTIGMHSTGKKSALIAKAKHGIMLMEMKGMHQPATEFKRNLFQYKMKQVGRVVLAIGFLCVLLLALAFVANS